MRRLILTAVLGTTLAAGLAGFTYPGPPGICHPIECGESASALDAAWKGVNSKNLTARLPAVLDQFAGNTSVRMEALRREANIDGAPTGAIVGGLALRALEQETAGAKTAPAALFDTGYAIHLFHTLGAESMSQRAVDSGAPGYAFVRRAIERGADAGMHVAAAYVLIPAAHTHERGKSGPIHELYKTHFDAALGTCSPGSVEEKNLASVFGLDGEKIAAARAKLAKK